MIRSRVIATAGLVAASACGSDQEALSRLKPVPQVLPGPPPLVEPISAPIASYLTSIPRMGQESRDYQPPDASTRYLARRAFAQLAAGHADSAGLVFGAIGYQLLDVRDGNQRYYVAREPAGQPIRGWGAYALNPTPALPYVFEAPHPQNDLYTGEQAVTLFSELGARAVLMSTSYRCATNESSRCSGKTKACGGKRRREPFRVSDMGHTDRSIFQMAHEALYDSLPKVVLVQLHGFDRRPDRYAHFVVSDGTNRRARRSNLANRLSRLLRKRIRRRRAVRSCNEYRDRPLPPLCGTTSVQGRHANGSPDPCLKRARKSRGRFLHVEQSIDARREGGLVEPQVLAEALVALARTLRQRKPRDLTPGSQSAPALGTSDSASGVQRSRPSVRADRVPTPSAGR